MHIRIFFILVGIIWIFLGCEEIDTTIYDGKTTINIVDPNVDSTREVPVIGVGIGIETGDYGLSWKECNGAQKYELEETSFTWGTRIVYSGKGLFYYAGFVKSDSPLTFRLRADYGIKYSLCSDPVTLPR